MSKEKENCHLLLGRPAEIWCTILEKYFEDPWYVSQSPFDTNLPEGRSVLTSSMFNVLTVQPGLTAEATRILKASRNGIFHDVVEKTARQKSWVDDSIETVLMPDDWYFEPDRCNPLWHRFKNLKRVEMANFFTSLSTYRPFFENKKLKDTLCGAHDAVAAQIAEGCVDLRVRRMFGIRNLQTCFVKDVVYSTILELPVSIGVVPVDLQRALEGTVLQIEFVMKNGVAWVARKCLTLSRHSADESDVVKLVTLIGDEATLSQSTTLTGDILCEVIAKNVGITLEASLAAWRFTGVSG